MSSKTRRAAIKAGAASEADFILFEQLSSTYRTYQQIEKLGFQTKSQAGAMPLTAMARYYELLLERGRFFQPQPLPPEHRRGKAKECFTNSYKRTLIDDSLTYCEGVVALKEGLPEIDHAWCVGADNRVIDVTLKEPGAAYFGVPFAAGELAGVERLPFIDHLLEDDEEDEVSSTHTVTLGLTQAQRRVVGMLLPDILDRLCLDERKQRSISFAASEISDIARKAGIAAGQARSGVIRNSLQLIIANCAKAVRAASAANQVLQFKITLLGVKPPVWRRILVKNGTLDRLHEHIQTAMGWTNSHLHQFEIKGERFGDPELLDDGFDDYECVDSTQTKLRDILPKSGRPFAFTYDYDFGDCWNHEVVFEGFVPAETDTKYPVCLEGARACPPEDCGGVPGYAEFLEAMRDKKHERHQEFKAWIGGQFDAEKFYPAQATKAMKKGLPDWRSMR